MKLYLLVPLCAAAAFPLAVTAEPSVDGAALAQSEAIVAHCSQVNPMDSAKYQELLMRLIADVPVEDLEAARKTEVYLRAYESVSGQLAQVPKDEAVAACADTLASNN